MSKKTIIPKHLQPKASDSIYEADLKTIYTKDYLKLKKITKTQKPCSK